MRSLLVGILSVGSLMALVPGAAAQHNCQTVFSVPSVVGLFRCDEDQNGSFERTELRSSFFPPSGTIVALGIHETGAYLTAPPAGAFAGYQRITFGAYTYTCGAMFVLDTAILVLCDVSHDWTGPAGETHTCHRITSNVLPPQEIDCEP